MNENNEISNASPPETAAQPSLDLPGRRKTRVGKLKLVLVALAMIALGAAGVTVYLQRLFQQHQEAKQAALNKPKDTASSDTTTDLEAQKARIKRDEADRARQASEAEAAAAAGRLATPAGAASQATVTNQQAGSQPNSPAPLMPAQRRLQGSVLAGQGDDHTGTGDHEGNGFSMPGSGAGNGGNGSRGATSMADMAKSMGLAALRGGGTGNAGGGSLAGATLGGDSNKGSSLDQSLQPSKLAAMRASFRPNRHYLISRNTQIRCVQDTAIRTDHSGLTGCTVAQDVWSDDGSTLLVRKGAEAKGEQRDAMLQGQGSIAVIWDEIDDGDVTIPLNSPATDQLGAAGIPAYVDEHFWMRFKGALMVSLIGDFGQALANKATGSGSQITFSNSSNATQDVAAETLRNTINIPPTAYSNQGSVINIFVARDVDLSQQYENVGIDGNPVGETTPQ